MSFEQKKVERNCLKKEKHTEFGVLSLEVESEGFTESYFLLASDCHRNPLKIGIGTLLLTQLIVTKKEAFQLLFNCGVGGVRTLVQTMSFQAFYMLSS